MPRMPVSTFKYTLWYSKCIHKDISIFKYTLKSNQDNGIPFLVQTELHSNIDQIIPWGMCTRKSSEDICYFLGISFFLNKAQNFLSNGTQNRKNPIDKPWSIFPSSPPQRATYMKNQTFLDLTKLEKKKVSWCESSYIVSSRVSSC